MPGYALGHKGDYAGPERIKATMRMITNAEPGLGGPITWTAAELQSNAGGRRFQGSPSLLKSTLQKNVRLCRAGSAVR